MQGKYVELTGRRFGRWKVLGRVWRLNTVASYYLCQCDCGTLRVVRGASLTRGLSKSCGCLRQEVLGKIRTSHKLCGTKIYNTWCTMKANQNKGITTLCDDWQEFMPFYEWAMSNGYSDELVLDRINKTKGYFPDNCAFVSYKQHCNNCLFNNYISYNGEVHTLTEWAELRGIPRGTLDARLNRYGWTVERALTTNVRPIRRR